MEVRERIKLCVKERELDGAIVVLGKEMGNQVVEHVVNRGEIKKDVLRDVCGDTNYNKYSILRIILLE